MSNGGWQPPSSGGTPPPGPGPSGPPTGPFQPPMGGGTPPGGPTQPVALEPAGQPPARSRGKVLVAGIGAAAIVGAGIFAFTRISGDSASGGAGTPEEAGQALVDALGNEDVLGAVDLLLPGERETLRQPMTDFVEEMRRLEVLSDDADLSDIGGVEIEIADSEIDVEDTNVEDIANLFITIDATASVNGDDLPIGDLILDNVDADPSDLDVDEESTSGGDGELPVTVVRKDGRWYVSLFYSAAEQLRIVANEDVPELEDAIAPTGGDSPEDAFDAFIGGIESLDLETIIASLNPNEFEALQRYAPLFIDQAQDEINSSDVTISIDEPDYTVSGEGDTRSMTVSYIAGEFTAEGETVGFSFEDGCAVLTPPEGSRDEPINTCELVEDIPELDDLFGESSEDVQQFLDTLEAAFEDYENPGFIVKQVSGQWYLSPMATGAEQVLAVLRALDRDEIEQLAEEGATAIEEVFGDLGGDIPFPDEITDDPIEDPIEPTDDTVDDPTEDTIDETGPDFTIPDVTLPDDGGTVPDDGTTPDDTEGFDACYSEPTAADATTCFQQLVDSGEIEVDEIPVQLRVPECGLSELYWSNDYYSLPDADFVAVVEAAGPCFADAVAAGTISEFEVPTEIANPECLGGINVFATDDDAAFEEYLDCVFG